MTRNRHRIARAGLAVVLGMLAVGAHQLVFAAQPRRAAASKRVARPQPATTHPASRPAASRPAAETRMQVVAYYFHRTLRCPSCLHIEATAKKAIEEGFAAEIDAGLVRWEAVDMQKRGKEHFAKDYNLSAPSLVLVKMMDGRQVSWKNCEKVWDLHRDEPAFAKYVQHELVSILSAPNATTSQPAKSPRKKGATK